MLPIRKDHPLKHLFAGLVEHAFQTELGICDPAVADYLSDLLIEFVRMDEMSIARDVAGRPVAEVADLIGQCELTGGLSPLARDRFVHRRLGDYTLFWTGIYPEGVKRVAGPSWRDTVAEYVNFGKRSYAIASELTPLDELPPPRLLRRLSEEFESCVHGLGLVRQELGTPGPNDGPEIIY
ncbi:MAG TPA: hypothetical protein P5572_03645 [Phycisphaerae bacterium]|nr:hypothetical protein [Phycisphaerae bacterium]